MAQEENPQKVLKRVIREKSGKYGEKGGLKEEEEEEENTQHDSSEPNLERKQRDSSHS